MCIYIYFVTEGITIWPKKTEGITNVLKTEPEAKPVKLPVRGSTGLTGSTAGLTANSIKFIILYINMS